MPRLWGNALELGRGPTTDGEPNTIPHLISPSLRLQQGPSKDCKASVAPAIRKTIAPHFEPKSEIFDGEKDNQDADQDIKINKVMC